MTRARARLLALEGWEPIEVPFPSAAEHQTVCAELGVRATPPTTWPTKYRRHLAADLEHRLARIASTGATATSTQL